MHDPARRAGAPLEWRAPGSTLSGTMAGATLVRTTLTGVRPLGVRGEPLHHAQAQLRAVVRRRLGDRHFHLLAEPQPHDLGGRIDWYSELGGTVRPLASVSEAERDAVRADI